jgi:hypothetical protein
MSNLQEIFGPVVFSYTRQQAIDDGVLVDVTKHAREMGFKYPVALTDTVYNDCVSWDNVDEPTYQDESGRLYDILWMAFLAARQSKESISFFEVYRIPNGGSEPKPVKLKLHCGPGDQAEPVITIMFPHED